MIERKVYNQEMIDRVAKYEAIMANPTLTNEEGAILAKEKYWQDVAKHQLRTLDLIAKLDELESDFMTHDECVVFANQVMRIIPPELEQNVDEWIDGRPLSNIKLHGWSVSDVMNQFAPKRQISFIDAIECLGKWKEAGYANKHFCRLCFMTK